MGFGSIIGGAVGGILNSNQNPLNSGFGSMTGGFFPPGINQLGDNFLNGYINYYYAEKAAKKANQRQIDFWNMQNAYNTPAAQMQRYREAGLNPNLIYGQTNMAGPVGTAHSGGFNMPNDRVQTAPFDLLNILHSYYGIQNLKQQNQNLKSQDTLLGSQAEYTKAQADRLKYETGWLKKHGTSSFEDPRIRSAKGSLGGYAQSFADVVGSGAGAVGGRLLMPRDEMVVKVKSFKGHDDELISLLRDMDRKGISYRFDYSD